MEVSTNELKQMTRAEVAPDWYEGYKKRIVEGGVDLLDEIKKVSEMKLEEITKHMGGKIEELPYVVLKELFIEGSEDQRVADILRKKRTNYLKLHPEEQISRGASEGVITYDGRFISKEDWDTASDSEKRAVLVGSTCFHFNSGTPGMDSNPEDRW